MTRCSRRTQLISDLRAAPGSRTAPLPTSGSPGLPAGREGKELGLGPAREELLCFGAASSFVARRADEGNLDGFKGVRPGAPKAQRGDPADLRAGKPATQPRTARAGETEPIFADGPLARPAGEKPMPPSGRTTRIPPKTSRAHEGSIQRPPMHCEWTMPSHARECRRPSRPVRAEMRAAGAREPRHFGRRASECRSGRG